MVKSRKLRKVKRVKRLTKTKRQSGGYIFKGSPEFFPLSAVKLYLGEGPIYGPAFDKTITSSIAALISLVEKAIIEKKNNLEILISRPPNYIVAAFGLPGHSNIFHPNTIDFTTGARSGYLQTMYSSTDPALKEWNDIMDKRFEKELFKVLPKVFDTSFTFTVREIPNPYKEFKINYPNETFPPMADKWVKEEPKVKMLIISWSPIITSDLDLA